MTCRAHFILVRVVASLLVVVQQGMHMHMHCLLATGVLGPAPALQVNNNMNLIASPE